MADGRLRVGILGAGEVAQVIHLPVLSMLSEKYITTAVCDISKKVTLQDQIDVLQTRRLVH
jgi:predicted dehydrogenase